MFDQFSAVDRPKIYVGFRFAPPTVITKKPMICLTATILNNKKAILQPVLELKFNAASFAYVAVLALIILIP